MTDHELLSLADRFGTPLYLFDERAIERRVELIESVCPPDVELCYAIKANPFVVPSIARRVPRLEVCSPGEVAVCEAAGIDPGSIVISGVHKDPTLMARLIAAPALPHRFTIESLTQLEMLHDLARAHGRTVPVLIRLTSGNQFGIDAADLTEVIRQRERYPHLDIRGVQFFSGTQKANAGRITRELARLDRFLAMLERDMGWRASELEYGPGLPVAYFEDDAFDERELLEAFGAALAALRFDGKVALEIGRALVADCGRFITRVVDAKANRGERYAIVDGGIHQIVYYGHSMAMREPPCRMLADGPARHAGGVDEERWNICGSLCTTNDILAKRMLLPGLEVGSLLLFEHAGAYCMTEGIALFLSRDLPAVVTIDADGNAHLARAAVPTHPLNTPRLERRCPDGLPVLS